MAYVTFDSNNNLTGVFANPQPHLEGYAIIDDSDPRIQAFAEAQTLPAAARSALLESDATILRCAEDNIPVPAAWASYRKALRDIVSNRSAGPLPAKPAYP